MTGILVAPHFDFLSFHTISEFSIHYFKIVFSLDSNSFLFSPLSGLQGHGIGGRGRGFCSHTPSSLLPALRILLLVAWRCIRVLWRVLGASDLHSSWARRSAPALPLFPLFGYPAGVHSLYGSTCSEETLSLREEFETAQGQLPSAGCLDPFAMPVSESAASRPCPVFNVMAAAPGIQLDKGIGNSRMRRSFRSWTLQRRGYIGGPLNL